MSSAIVDENSLLNIFGEVEFDEIITKYEYHSYQPYASATLKNDDEIRIPIQAQDIYTLPHDSSLYLEGTIEMTDKDGKIINNGYAFLFDEIRYEINGVEVDRNREVGITSTMMGMLTMNKNNLSMYEGAGWTLTGVETSTRNGKYFNASIPLKLLLGFTEMYRKVLINCKQELVLLRSRNDHQIFKAKDGKLTLQKLQWRMPHIHVNDEVKLKLLRHVKVDRPIIVPFRRYELHELPQLKENTVDKWAISTTTQLEKPRYIIIAFQTGKKNVLSASSSDFDNANLRNYKVYLNSEFYPYDKQDLDFSTGKYATAYQAYVSFQSSYYGENRSNSPIINYKNYKECPLFVVDCSKQSEVIKSSTVDIQLEIEANEKFPANTAAYCLIIHDAIIEYNPLTGLVHKIL